MLHFEACHILSKYNSKKVGVLACLFGISGPSRAEAPSLNDRSRYPKHGAICIYNETHYAGFPFPPPL